MHFALQFNHGRFNAPRSAARNTSRCAARYGERRRHPPVDMWPAVGSVPFKPAQRITGAFASGTAL